MEYVFAPIIILVIFNCVRVEYYTIMNIFCGRSWFVGRAEIQRVLYPTLIVLLLFYTNHTHTHTNNALHLNILC